MGRKEKNKGSAVTRGSGGKDFQLCLVGQRSQGEREQGIHQFQD